MTPGLRVRVGADGRGEVVGRDAGWPFDVDVATGFALVRAPGGAVVARVRGLRWRERIALARFAGLGTGFRTRAVAAACGSAREAGGPDDEIIALVAGWLDDPAGRGSSIDDDDPVSLASVTLELCRLTGLSPRDIDDLPASEVVELWTAAAGQADVDDGATRDDGLQAWADGMTRIVVLDDALAGTSGDAGRADGTVEWEATSPSEDQLAGDGNATSARAPEPPTIPDSDDGGGLAARERPAEHADAAAAPQSGVAAPSDPTGAQAQRRAAEPDRAPIGSRAIRVRRVAADPPVLGGPAIPSAPSTTPAATPAASSPTPAVAPAMPAGGPLTAVAAAEPLSTSDDVARIEASGSPRTAVAPSGLDGRPIPRRPGPTGSRSPARPVARRGTRPEDRRSDLSTAATGVVPPWPWAALSGDAPGLGGIAHGAWPAPATTPVGPDAWAAEASTAVAAPAAGTALRETLLEQLSDELERAATQLGIAEAG